MQRIFVNLLTLSFVLAICCCAPPVVADDVAGRSRTSLSAEGWSVDTGDPSWKQEYAKRIRLVKDDGRVQIETKAPGVPVPVRREIPTLGDILVTMEIELPPLETIPNAKSDSGQIVVRVQSIATASREISVAIPPAVNGKTTRHRVLIRRQMDETTISSTGIAQKRIISGPIRVELELIGRTLFWVTFELEGGAKSAVAAMSSTKNSPSGSADTTNRTVEVPLPGPVDQIEPADNGRFLLMHSPQIGKLIVFDTEAKKISHIETVGGSILLAGGKAHAVVIDKQSKVISRYQIDPFKREQSVPIPDGINVLGLTMGMGSTGPILMASNETPRDRTAELTFLDLPTLAPLVATVEPEPMIRWSPGNTMLRSSADGSSFGISNGGATLISKRGDKYEAITRSGLYRLIPGPLGNQIYSNEGVLGGQLNSIGLVNRSGYTWCFPATRGPFYVSLQPLSRIPSNRELRVELRLPQRGMSVAVLDDLRISRTSDPNPMPLDRRVIYHPPAKAIIMLADSHDRLLIRDIDPYQHLRDSGDDYLLVVSQPPSSVAAGTRYQYQIEAISNHPPVKFALTSSPAGMAISATGQISWQIPNQAAGLREHVIVTLTSASGESIFHTFPLQVDGTAMLADAEPVEPAPPQVEEQTIKLPATFDQIAVGGGGRMLLLTLPSIQKLAVIDLAAGKIAKFLSLPERALVAAGQDKFVIVIPDQKLIQRWDLQSLARELTTALDADLEADVIAMGSASQGPILIGGGSSHQSKFKLLDLDQLRPLTMTMKKIHGNIAFSVDRSSGVRAAADGSMFSSWRTSGSPSGLFLLSIDGSTANSSYIHTSVGYIAPGPDGSRIYTAAGIYSPDLQLKGQRANSDYPIPATSGNYYLRVRCLDRNVPDEKDKSPFASIFVVGNAAPLVTLPDVKVSSRQSRFMSRDINDLDQRILFLPGENLFATLPASNDTIVLRTCNIEAELKRSEIDYLFVTSQPPKKVKPGAQLVYKIDVMSNKGAVRFKLESGPPGMTVDEGGRIRWKVGPVESNPVPVMVVISDASQQEIFHTFRLDVFQERSSEPASKPGIPLSPLRIWTDATGKFTVQASLMRCQDDKVYLRTLEGEELMIDLKQLSDKDQEAVRQLTGRID